MRKDRSLRGVASPWKGTPNPYANSSHRVSPITRGGAPKQSTHEDTEPSRERGAQCAGAGALCPRASFNPGLCPVAAQPNPLLFAIISAAHHYGFPSFAALCFMLVAATGCSPGSPLRGSEKQDAGANLNATEAIVRDTKFESTKPSSSQPVTAAMQIIPTEVRNGVTFELLVSLEIAGAHHVYASNIVGKPFIPLSLNVTLPDGIEALNDWIAPAPSRTKTGELVYTDSVSFRRSLRVGSNVPAGPLLIKGDLRYQACTEELCWPPRTIDLSSSINISSPGN